MQPRLSTTDASTVQPVAEELAQAQIQEPTAPPPSLWTQVGKWISGETKRERKAIEAQAQAQAEHAAAEQKRQRKAQAEEEHRQQLRARFHETVAGLENSDQPLIHFSTFDTPPQRHFAWREHYLEALGDKGNLPICDGRGVLLTDDQGEARGVSYIDVQWQTIRALAFQHPVRAESSTLDQSEVGGQKHGPKRR